MPSTPWQDHYINAYRFSAQSHSGQTVPGTDIPYLMHLSLVSMEVVASFTADPWRDAALAVQCALLHDVIEDTATTYVFEAFGQGVAEGVLALTKDVNLQAGPDSRQPVPNQGTVPRGLAGEVGRQDYHSATTPLLLDTREEEKVSG